MASRSAVGDVRHPSAYRFPTGEDLRKLRVLAGLSQQEAARRSGLAQATIARTERNAETRRVSTIMAMLDVYREAHT